jgi:uncharacterized protein (DUF1330 family)
VRPVGYCGCVGFEPTVRAMLDYIADTKEPWNAYPSKWGGLIAFEDIDAAKAAFSSPAYKQARTIGEKMAQFRIFAIEGKSQ